MGIIEVEEGQMLFHGPHRQVWYRIGYETGNVILRP